MPLATRLLERRMSIMFIVCILKNELIYEYHVVGMVTSWYVATYTNGHNFMV